jgi:hypothetical protein
LQRVLTTVTLLGLLVATASAFAITEHLKLEKSALYGTLVTVPTEKRSAIISPVCDCPTRAATIRIRLRHASRVTITIADSAGNQIDTLVSDALLGAHSPQHRTWNGHTSTGAVAPDGIYHPWVQLGRKKFRFANKIVVDTKPPQVRSATVLKPVLFAGPGRSVAIQYAFSEPAHALVYLDGRQIILGHQTRPSSKIKWAGRLDGKPLRAGKYVLSIGARDLAGNETPAAMRMHVTVVVRYVELTPQRIAVAGGGRIEVHVKTALRRYKWRLGKRHGERRGKVLRLRAPSTPGTYRLVVGEPGQSATAVVKVHK